MNWIRNKVSSFFRWFFWDLISDRPELPYDDNAGLDSPTPPPAISSSPRRPAGSFASEMENFDLEIRQLRTNIDALRRILAIEEYQTIRRHVEDLTTARPNPMGPHRNEEEQKRQEANAERARLLRPYVDLEDNLRPALHRLFDRDEQSLVRFFGERLHYIDQGMAKVKDEQFINFALFIPRRKKLPTDYLKTILLSIQGSGDSSGIFTNKIFYGNVTNENLPLVELETNELMSIAFKDYSDEDIKTLFSRRYYVQDWVNIIRWALMGHKKSLPIFKTLREIQFYIRSQEKRSLQNKALKTLPVTKDGLTYELYTDNQQVMMAGYSFQNCLRYNFYPLSDLVAVKSDTGELVAIVEVNNQGSICQIKGSLNAAPPNDLFIKISQAIKDVIRENS